MLATIGELIIHEQPVLKEYIIDLCVALIHFYTENLAFLKENDLRGEVFLTKGSKIFVDPNQAIGCTYTGVGSAPTMTCSCHSRNILLLRRSSKYLVNIFHYLVNMLNIS